MELTAFSNFPRMFLWAKTRTYAPNIFEQADVIGTRIKKKDSYD